MTLIKSISGIRGTIGGHQGENLTPRDVVKFTAGYAQWIREKNSNPLVVVGRDARTSGKMISNLVTATLQGMGINVLDLGLSTTPTVEMAVVNEKASGGIILTASHNPKEWNALKLLNDRGEFVSAREGATILSFSDNSHINFAEIEGLGAYKKKADAIKTHIEQIMQLDLVDEHAIRQANFKIVVDGVNSTGGIAIPELLNRLGVNVVERLFCEPTGEFPHNPEPLPEHLTAISDKIRSGDFDLGIVVDPDVDRLAFVNEDGTLFGEEYTLVAVADYVLQHKKGPAVSNLSSSRALKDICHHHGVEYHAAAVGEVNVVEKMKAVGAVIGGEGNGGIIYPELHYGRDALVGIALFLTHLARKKSPMTAIKAELPAYSITKNKLELTPEIDVDQVLASVKEKYAHEELTDIDGVKVDFNHGWVHLRKSNTEPIIRVYAEAGNEELANELANQVMEEIHQIIFTKADT